jgi:hypothetical protein
MKNPYVDFLVLSIQRAEAKQKLQARLKKGGKR